METIEAVCMMCENDLGYEIPNHCAVICSECRQKAQDLIDRHDSHLTP